MKTTLQRLFLSAVYGLLYLPILILVIYSVNDAKYSLIWHGFSLRWYAELFADHSLWLAFFNSVILGLCSALVATTFGLLTSVNLFLFKNANQRFLYGLLLLLIVIPDLVLGVALLIFFNYAHVSLGFFSLHMFLFHFLSSFCPLIVVLKPLIPTFILVHSIWGLAAILL